MLVLKISAQIYLNSLTSYLMIFLPIRFEHLQIITRQVKEREDQDQKFHIFTTGFIKMTKLFRNFFHLLIKALTELKKLKISSKKQIL